MCTERWLADWRGHPAEELIGFRLADPDPLVIVLQESFGRADDPYQIIQSNIQFLNALREGLFVSPELCADHEQGRSLRQ